MGPAMPATCCFKATKPGGRDSQGCNFNHPGKPAAIDIALIFNVLLFFDRQNIQFFVCGICNPPP
jgi:hypothetical protein